MIDIKPVDTLQSSTPNHHLKLHQALPVLHKLGALKIEIYKTNEEYVKTIWGNTSNGLLSPRSGRYYSNTYTSWSIVLCSRYDLRWNRHRLRHKGNYHVNRARTVLTSRIFFSEESMPRVLFFINNDFQKNFQIWRYHLAL